MYRLDLQYIEKSPKCPNLPSINVYITKDIFEKRVKLFFSGVDLIFIFIILVFKLSLLRLTGHRKLVFIVVAHLPYNSPFCSIENNSHSYNLF